MFFFFFIKGSSLENNIKLAAEASRYGWEHINFSYNQNDFQNALDLKEDLSENLEEVISFDYTLEIKSTNIDEIRKNVNRFRSKALCISVVGGDLKTGEITDIVFDYDPETGTLTLDSDIVILITGKPKTTNFYYFWSTLTLVKKASDETPDAISTINAKQENGAIYNLQGVKMNKPTQKGVYIHNGRKVIVK